jgi:hypothetical protein
LAKAPINNITKTKMMISQTGRSEPMGFGGATISAEYEIGRAVGIINSCLIGKEFAQCSAHKTG